MSGRASAVASGIDALVQRVGLEVRPDEVGHEALAGVDDVGARGAGGHRPLLDALAQRAAAEVDREGHDLDVELLAQPGDGDGRVESARVGEDDLLHESGPPDRLGGDASACDAASEAAVEPALEAGLVGEQDEERIVARQRAFLLGQAWTRRWPGRSTLAVPGVPVRTRIRPLRPTVTGMSARIRRRRSSEAARAPSARSVRARRRRGGRRAVTLTRPSSATSRADRRLGDAKPARRQRVDELAAGCRSARARRARGWPAGGGASGRGRSWASSVLASEPVTRRRRAAGRTAVMRVPNVGSSRARVSASGADESAMIASAPSQAERPERRPDLGHHAAGDDAGLDERLGLAGGERVEPAAVGVADAVDVGQQDELAGAETGRDARRPRRRR